MPLRVMENKGILRVADIKDKTKKRRYGHSATSDTERGGPS